jgi:uncharacterized protein YeaO (DUF488 family)
MGKILVKRVYEPAGESDGFRVLVDRLWPRGVSKAEAKLDLWLKDLGPSTTLRTWFNHEPARWEEFQRRYRAELKAKGALLSVITEQAKASPVTLLYSAKEEQHNQAVALRGFLMKRSARIQSATRAKNQSRTIPLGKKVKPRGR